MLLCTALLSLPAQAVSKYWVGGSGSWDDPDNWSPVGQPQDGDDVRLYQDDDVDRIVSYANSAYPSAVLGNLHLTSYGDGTITLSQSGDSLQAVSELIEGSGPAGEIRSVFLQSGGTNSVTGWLEVDRGGSYELSGTGSLSTDTVSVGAVYGQCTFTQSGGTHAVAGLLGVGGSADATALYTLSGGDLSAVDEWIGGEGTAVFIQTGGTNAVTDTLELGIDSGTEGRYELIDGELSAEYVTVGYQGDAAFVQSGGTNTAWDLLIDARAGGSASYELRGGSLSVEWEDILTGSFTQSGGTHTVSQDLALHYGSSYTLSGGELSSWVEYVGLNGSGTFTQSGGTNNAGLFLGYSSGSSGSYVLSDTGVLDAGAVIIGVVGSGSFVQSGGTNSVADLLSLGQGPGSTGSYDLSAGDLSARDEYVGEGGSGAFVQSGGTNAISRQLVLGLSPESSGSYALHDGSLSAEDEYIGYQDTGVFTQSGGTNSVTHGLLVGSGSGGSGRYELSDGELLAEWVHVGSPGGTSTFVQSGGTSMTYTLDVSSGASYELSGGALHTWLGLGIGAGGALRFSGGTLSSYSISNGGDFELSGAGTRIVDGDVNNTGTITVTDTEAIFTGRFSNSGAYISDPSDSRFLDITLDETGYLVGGEGDRFFVSADFLSSSEASILWDTLGAELIFQHGGRHTLRYTGEDRGPGYGGYADNFAWGGLRIQAGQSLTLEDGDATPGGAIYVELLDLGGGLDQVALISGNGMSIYYDPLATGNEYLGGQTFSLTGGGVIAPVPEPGAALLLGLGLAGLACHRRRTAPRSAV